VVGDLAGRTVLEMRALVDFAFWRLVVLIIVLVGATLLAALAYRVISRKLARG
jgi:hypothetical protein